MKIGYFWTILTKTCFWSNQSNIFTKMVQNSSMNIFFDNFCKKFFADLNKTNFLSKLSKNGQFSQNKVPKITNKKFFPIKSKMFTIYDFHIDFHFQVHLTTLRVLQMVWYPRITKSGPGRPRMRKIEIFF